MVSSKVFLGAILALGVQSVLAQQPLWAQCGGQGWTGGTTCVSGACCQVQNQWYSQCVQGNCSPSGQPSSTRSATTPQPTNGGSPSRGCGKAPISSGQKSVNVNGRNREYIIRVPNNYDNTRPYRLFFAFHWRGGSMNDVSSGGTDGALWSYYGQQRVAQESAILVAPNGIGGGWANSGGEDVAFVDAMIAQIEDALCVNQQARFAMGFSYGGAMSYSLACSRPNVFRGVAVMSGGQLSGCSGGTSPVAYLGIHGVSDNVLGIGGGRSLRDRFVANNGCTATNPREPSPGSGQHVKTQYSGCRSGYPVTWLAFDGGHWPGAVDGGGESGARSYVPGEIYSFFSGLS